MSRTREKPLFVDTNAFVALFDADDERHESARTVLDGIRDGRLPYGPSFTSRFVVSETATTVLTAAGHDAAVEAVRRIRESASIDVLGIDPGVFDRTVSQFARYDDHQISFVDHMNAGLAAEYDVDHVFAFDDDFVTLGLTRVPLDTGSA